MIDTPLFAAMFSFTGVLYGLIIPVVLFMSIAILFIPCMLHMGAKPKGVGKALYCFGMQGLGILLMTAGALPTVISVLTQVNLAGATYFTLLFLFAVGGIVFLWHDNMIHEIDAGSRAVPEAIFHTVIRLIGGLTVVIWFLSFIISLFGGGILGGAWWVMPIVMMVYGGVLLWCVRGPALTGGAVLRKAATSSARKPQATRKKSTRRKKK